MTDERRSLLPVAEVGLAVVTLATVLGMRRLFVDGSFFWPLTAHALAAHAIATACRRRGIGAVPAAAIMLGAAALAMT